MTGLPECLENSYRFGAALQLPLSQKQFRHAIAVGLGRARLHIDHFGPKLVREEIFDAATVCKVYDPQSDGIPARWLADLCVQAGLAQAVAEHRVSDLYWDREQRCALLKELVLLGVEPARPALYASCERERGTSHVFACREIVGLDGEAGLLFVARTLGGLLDADATFWVDDAHLQYFDEQYGQGRAAAVLAAQDDAAIQRYLDGVASTAPLRRRPRAPPTRKTVDEVASAILAADQLLDWVHFWARRATDQELEVVLRLATPTSSALLLDNVLWCLSGGKAPPIQPWLLGLLEHGEASVRSHCAMALGQSAQPSVRVVGLAALQSDLWVAMTLLRGSALREDSDAIVAALRVIEDRDAQHDVVCHLNELMRDGRVYPPLLALYVYERSPCMDCRAKAVRALVAHGSVPDWLRAECARDASEEVRQALGGGEA